MLCPRRVLHLEENNLPANHGPRGGGRRDPLRADSFHLLLARSAPVQGHGPGQLRGSRPSRPLPPCRTGASSSSQLARNGPFPSLAPRPGTHVPTRHCEFPCIFPPVRIPWGGPSPGERKKPLLVGEGPEEAAACVFGVHIDGKTAFASWALWSLRGSGLVAGSPSQRGPREPRASPRGKSRREWRSEGPAGSSRVCAPSLLRETRCRDT